MNTPNSGLILRRAAAAGLLAGAMAFQAAAAERTALPLIKEGNRYIGEQSRNKLLQVRSERSVGGLLPTLWYVAYYDPDARFKVVEVKFGDGTKLDVARPIRPFERKVAARLFEPSEVKVDSDRAIRVATGQPLLEKLTLKATQLWLERGESGPVWRVRIWAAKRARPDKLADVGDVYVSASDGKVVRTDLHIGTVD